MAKHTSFLVTGGAGFVGSNLCLMLREKFPNSRVLAFDNLRRRGSELNLPRLKAAGVEFQHGDIRSTTDLFDLSGNFDVCIEASAEPSVLSGMNGSPHYVQQTNLVGTLNCLDFARQRTGRMLFLSTSRVYSIPELLRIPLTEGATRFELSNNHDLRGLSAKGISEEFSTGEFRSIYGASKLSSELFVQEYAHTYGYKSIINRCGVLAGPWQMGKVDQGVFTLWMARHFFKSTKPGPVLNYTGFGGKGLQVRDLLHPRDLFELLLLQLEAPDSVWNGSVYNVGGGNEVSVSLKELTALCQQITGNRLDIGLTPVSSSVDIPFYVTDSSLVQKAFAWTPKTGIPALMTEIFNWLKANEKELQPLFS